MTIEANRNGDEVTLKIIGRLDTVTAPELETKLKEIYEGLTSLVFDFTELEYISSAGLRVMLGAQKVMNKLGKMIVTNVNPAVMEVFEITGFNDILTIV